MVCPRFIKMICRPALLALAVLLANVAFAQTPAQKVKPTFKAPAEVEKALRDRVTEFFQYHVDGNFRKAYNMVAEDTQDYYFAALKMKFEAFRITGIRFVNDDCTKASVDLETQQKMNRVEFKGIVVPMPMTTAWKLEKGQWVWYRDPTNAEVTPMGLSDLGKLHEGTNDEKAQEALKRLTDPAALQQKADEILHPKSTGKQSGIDRPDVTLSRDKASSAEVGFHNGWPGNIKLVLDPGAKLAGFTAAINKADVNMNEDAVLKVSYTPPANGSAVPELPESLQVRLFVEPFNLIYPVTVKFAAPSH
jgi:hypothetical protein